MLSDDRIRILVDYPNAADVFPGVRHQGWRLLFPVGSRHDGVCEVTTISDGELRGTPVERHLDEFDIFVRDNEALSILRKVARRSRASRLSALECQAVRAVRAVRQLPRGEKSARAMIRSYVYRPKRWHWVIARIDIGMNVDLDRQMESTSDAAAHGRQRERPCRIGSQQAVYRGARGRLCTETYLVASVRFDTKSEAENVAAYLRTRFVRFLVSLRKPAQHQHASVYTFVPDLQWDQHWTDEELYKKYGITDDELAFIESMIRPMMDDTTMTRSDRGDPRAEAGGAAADLRLDSRRSTSRLRRADQGRPDDPGGCERAHPSVTGADAAGVHVARRCSAERDDGTMFRDSDVRQRLVDKGFENVVIGSSASGCAARPTTSRQP